MVKIRIGATVDPLEKLLMNLVADWDELERWLLRYGGTDRAKIAGEQKAAMLDKLAAIKADREE